MCNQTGKKMVVAVSKLSRETGELSRNDVYTPGTQLLLDENGRAYPVTVISQGTKKAGTASKKQQQRKKDGDDDDLMVTKKQERVDNGDDDEPVVTKKKQQTEDDDDDDDEPNKMQRKDDSDDDEPLVNKKKRQRIDDDDNESMTSERQQQSNNHSDVDKPLVSHIYTLYTTHHVKYQYTFVSNSFTQRSRTRQRKFQQRRKLRKRDDFKENIMLLAKDEVQILMCARAALYVIIGVFSSFFLYF